MTHDRVRPPRRGESTTLPPLTPNAWLRFDLIMEALGDVPEGDPVLEVGCGQGALGRRLAERYHYTGVELDPNSARVAKARMADVPGSAAVHHGSFETLPDDQRFAAVCAFEVIEHLPDDYQALADWAERLQPGGKIVLSVPAHAHRMAAADQLAGHYRRYDPGQLSALMDAVGLEDVQESMYGFPFGYLLEGVRNVAARRRQRQGSMEERTSASGRFLQPTNSLGLVTYLAALPFRWLQRPFRNTTLGTGLVAVGRNPR